MQLIDKEVGNITARTSIEVEEPIDGHWLSCGEELTVRTDPNTINADEVRLSFEIAAETRK
jgi:hypothetical protein